MPTSPTTHNFMVVGTAGAVLDALCELIDRQPGWRAMRVTLSEEAPAPPDAPVDVVVTSPDSLSAALTLEAATTWRVSQRPPLVVIGGDERTRLRGLDRRTFTLDHRDQPSMLIDGLRSALDGSPVTRSEHRASAGRPRLGLTPRQLEVMGLLAQGWSHTEIARMLGLSPHTLRTHIQNLMARTGLRSRVELVAVAIREGLADTRRAG